METLTERIKREVKAGADLLDAEGPERWWDKVNIKTMIISSPHYCILQQVYGEFLRGLDTLRISQAHAFGFAWSIMEVGQLPDNLNDLDAMYSDAWADEIRMRRELSSVIENAESLEYATALA